jgi:hypothetical protein
MAKQKANYVESLKKSHDAFLTIQKEMTGNEKLMILATSLGDDAAIDQVKMIAKRYEADFEYLAKQRAYYLGKAIETSPVLFDKILKEILS